MLITSIVSLLIQTASPIHLLPLFSTSAKEACFEGVPHPFSSNRRTVSLKPCEGLGTWTTLMLLSLRQRSSIPLEVPHVPKLSTNLVSIHNLTNDLNYTVTFSSADKVEQSMNLSALLLQSSNLKPLPPSFHTLLKDSLYFPL